MLSPTDSHGLHFLPSTPSHWKDGQYRGSARAHARKAGKRRWQPITIKSALLPNRQLQILHPQSHRPRVSSPVGSYLSGLKIADGFEWSLVQDLVRLVAADIDGMYVHEVVFNTHPVERGWFPYMISDSCCLHSLLFSLGMLEATMSKSGLSTIARFHYNETLRHLQLRIDNAEHLDATSDATIMVVVLLASIARLANEHATAENHMRGMEKMLLLRGGLESLDSHRNMQVKVCRADLSHAMYSGTRPILTPHQAARSCFDAKLDPVKCRHHTLRPEYWDFIRSSVSPDLRSALTDLHAFSCMINLAFQASRTIQAETYNDIMISILYRLTSQHFNGDHMQETLRLGMMCFCTSIFMQYRHVKHQYSQLFDSFNEHLEMLFDEDRVQLPAPMALWLLMLPDVAHSDKTVVHAWRRRRLSEILLHSPTDTWSKARDMLGTAAWVGFLHDKAGEGIFDSITGP